MVPAAVVFMLGGLSASAQDDSEQPVQFSISGSVDVFYAFDFNNPGSDSRQPFFYNHNRHNEFNLNLGIISAEVAHERYRAVLALQTGTYAADNYAEEPVELRNIFEAYAGLCLSANQDLWLDVGVFESHIGFEYAESAKNPTLTRSLVAEHSPYFLTGARLTWQADEKWTFLLTAANGWQRIRRVRGNSLLSFGSQVYYKPSEDWELNWSTLIGTDDPDTERRMIFYNNLYAEKNLTEKLRLTAGFDIGARQAARGSERYDAFLTPTLILRCKFTDRWAAALRGEYYHDPEGAVIPTETDDGFEAAGYSVNIDYSPRPGVICRVEWRRFEGRNPVFSEPGGPGRDNMFVAASVAVLFGGR